MQNDAEETPGQDLTPYFTAMYASHDPASERMRQAYRLRFQVYCIDCGFLPAADYPGEEETDEYDDASDHFFAYNLGDDLVGYARLVRHDPPRALPWQAHCPQVLPGVHLPPPDLCAEVSRLMVRRDYRRRKGDLVTGANTNVSDPADTSTPQRRSNTPQIMLCLYRQMYQRSRRSGIRYWYAAMEVGLARTLQFMGFAFQRIGDQVDYFGPVAPYLADLDVLERDLKMSNPELLEWMQAPERGA